MVITKKRFILEICALFAVLILVVAVISVFWPSYEERFFELGLLGKDKKADNYFPDNNSTITDGSIMNWHIYVHNHVGTSQNVLIKVKLQNSLIGILDSLESDPSSTPTITEFFLSLPENDSVFVSFSWSILEKYVENNSINIKQLLVNDQIISLDIPASLDSFFSMIFELWIYDQSTEKAYYAMQNIDGFSSVSVNMGFELS